MAPIDAALKTYIELNSSPEPKGQLTQNLAGIIRGDLKIKYS